MTEPKVWTRIECALCKKIAIRRFERGDFIFKELDYQCPYCGDRLVITGIWRDDSRTVGE